MRSLAGDSSNGGQLTTAIDALLDPTAGDNDLGIAFHTACPFHRGHVHWLSDTLDVERTHHGSVVITVTAAKHVAPNGTAVDGDASGVGNHAQLTAAIDVALDDRTGTSDGQEGLFHLGQVRPEGVDSGTSHFFKTTLGAAKYVAANGVLFVVEFRFVVVADDAASDGDGIVTMGWA